MSVRTLVLCGDLWHPSAIAQRGLKRLGHCGFDFERLKHGADWLTMNLKAFPVVVLAKANVISSKDQRPWLTEKLQQDFCNHIRRGNGLVIIHSGTAGYAELPIMRRLIGGAFLRHPPQCAVTITPKAGQLLADGVAPFTIRDEHYFVASEDQRAKVFLHASSEHGTQPAGWTRVEGRGRVCVVTPGHNAAVWAQPSFQQLLRNALRWVAGPN